MSIEYKSDTDMNKKLCELREKYSLEAEYSDVHNIFLAMSRMTLDKIKQISTDEDIIKINGRASLIIRA